MAARSTATPPAQQRASASRLAAHTVHATPAANAATGSFHETVSIQHRQQMSHRDVAYGCGKWRGRMDRWMGRRAPVDLWIGKCWHMAAPIHQEVRLASTYRVILCCGVRIVHLRRPTSQMRVVDRFTAEP